MGNMPEVNSSAMNDILRMCEELAQQMDEEERKSAETQNQSTSNDGTLGSSPSYTMSAEFLQKSADAEVAFLRDLGFTEEQIAEVQAGEPKPSEPERQEAELFAPEPPSMPEPPPIPDLPVTEHNTPYSRFSELMDGAEAGSDSGSDSEDVFHNDNSDLENLFAEQPVSTPTRQAVQTPVQENPYAEELEQIRRERAELQRQMNEFNKMMAQMNQQILTQQQFQQQAIQQNREVVERVRNTTQEFERVTFTPKTTTFCGKTFKYDSYNEKVSFGADFREGMSTDNLAKGYIALSEEVCKDIEQKFGGWEMIHDFAIVSNLLIINSVAYQPVLPQEYIRCLPFDIRNNVSAGQYAWLFDFGYLKKMKNLVNLRFDSADFVYMKVRKDFRSIHGFSCSTIFKYCKKLNTLQIGDKILSKKNASDGDELFIRASKAEKLYQSCCDATWNFTKNRWQGVQDMFMNPDASGLSKVWGVTWRGVASVGGLAVTVGALTAGGIATKVVKGVSNLASAIKDNM